MAAIFAPLRIDRVQQALFEVFAEATGVDVGWSYQEVPQESLGASFIDVSMIGGPIAVNRKHRRGRATQTIDTVTLTVGPLVIGKRLGVVLNGFNYFEDAVGGDTPTTVRDRLLAQVNAADNIEPVTASSTGADDLVLTADFTGAISELKIYGTITAGTPTYAAGRVLQVAGAQTMLVNVQAYSKQREPRLGAWTIVMQCQAALQTEDLVEKLRRFGVGVWDYTAPVDLSAVAGGHWETRASFDLTVAAQARWARPVDEITTVEGTVNGEAFAAP